jgi:hypothetical protein
MSHYEKKLKTDALDPKAWIESAARLSLSAEMLETHFDEFWNQLKIKKLFDDSKISTLFMIYSYMIENLLKALIVIKDKQDLLKKDWKKLPSSLQSHNLYQLCKKSGLESLAREYESILKRLSRSAEWYGRYPTPIKASDFENIRCSENEPNGLSLSQQTSNDLKEIKDIINELKVRLEKYV